MLTAYIHFLLRKAVYILDEAGYFFAEVPGYQGYISQGETIEDARENLRDAIEGVIILKLSQGDSTTSSELAAFMKNNTAQYA